MSNEEPDLSINPFSQIVGEKKGSKFEQTPMMLIDHLDMDKHWIGEALPSPSTGEIKTAGIISTTGSSPFPARADHTHDVAFRSSFYQHEAKTMPPGGTFFNSWNFISGFNILDANQQLFLFPDNAVYIYKMHFSISAAASMSGGFNLRETWGGSQSFSRVMIRDVLSGLGNTGDETYSFGHTPSANDYVQFSYEQSDVQNHTVTVDGLTFHRLGLFSG